VHGYGLDFAALNIDWCDRASAAGFVHAWFTHVHAFGDSLVIFVKNL
jgi:hypothetical protein